MKNIKILIFILLASVATAAIYQVIPNKVDDQKVETYDKGSPYDKLWKTTDSLAGLGLTRSVLDVVKVIYDKAKEENNAPMFVKAVIYRLKYESYITEDDYFKAISDLTEEAKTTKHPIKPVINSVLAEVYWRYYQQNRSLFSNRTETQDFVPDDLRTWDLRKILEKVIENYQISLENADSSKQISLHLYNEILIPQNNSKKVRPTLYDFLAHRAIDFFMTQESGLSRPADRFTMNDPVYYSDFEKFATMDLKTTDTYALKYYAIRTFQDLLKFHMKDSDPEALIDVELKRIRFVRANTFVENADTLYLDLLRNLEKRYITHPSSTQITYEIASYWSGIGDKYAPLVSDEYKWMKVKAYQICEGAKTRYPQSSGAYNCTYLQNAITAKSIQFQSEETAVPGKPYRVYFSYRNLSKVYVRICPLDHQWQKKIERKYYGEDLIKQYTRLNPDKEFSVEIPNDKDYQGHSVEIKMPEMQEGYYMILMSEDPNFPVSSNAIAYNEVFITNMSYIKRIDDESNTVFTVIDSRDGSPVEGANVQIWKEKYSYTTRDYEFTKGASMTTDKNGVFSLPARNDYNYSYCYAEIKNGKDLLNTEGFYQNYRYDYKNERIIKTVFFTDRAIYRPGQSIYFKGIVLECEGEKTEIKPKYTTNVTLYDVNHQKVSDLLLTSNEYGTFDGVFTAPVGSLTGQMYISDVHGSVYFSVEEYKRPKFEVNFDPVKGSYKLGEKVTVTGQAKAYAGSNIDNAEVKYRVVRTASFPYWWYYRWGYYPNSPQIEVINGTTKTDENGTYTIQFNAIPDYTVNKNSFPVFNYAIYADVTDLNGETRSAVTNVKASNTALQVAVAIPSEIDKGKPGTYEIQTTNLSGQSQHSKGTIEVFKLKEPDRILRKRAWARPDRQLLSETEFRAAFPYDAYSNENEVANYPKEKRVFDHVFNTAQDSILDFGNISGWPTGHYILEITSHDIYGTEVSSKHYFTIYSQSDKAPPVNEFDWFTTLKAKGEPGETASFLIATKDTAKVLYEIEHKGKIIYSDYLTLINEQRKFDIPIKEEFRGNFSVHFTYVRHNRLYKHDVVVTVPYTNKELDITYETFRNKVLPGSQEEWLIKIKGKDGQKVAAEMLAGMYDASLDAFRANSWSLNLYQSYYSQLSWSSTACFRNSSAQVYQHSWNQYSGYVHQYYDALNWFGFTYYYRYNSYYYDDYYGFDGDVGGVVDEIADVTTSVSQNHKRAEREKDSPVAAAGKSANTETSGDINLPGEEGVSDRRDAGEQSNNQNGGGAGIKTRTNFNETAFFYPHLETDSSGSVIIRFTMPEALTRWRFMGLATTKDLMVGYTEKEIVTQKELMIMTNPPRFLREGDKITFSAKITNLTPDSLCGEAELYLFDALTNQPIDDITANKSIMQIFDVKKGQSTEVSWDIEIPFGLQALTYKIYAKSGNFTDGEEMIIPVLTNRMLVTESMPLPIRGKTSKEFNFSKLVNSGNSSTLRHQKYTLEFTSNPAWYAIQALPYLMEYPYECAEQTFSRFYANSIASHIANSHPRIKAVFDSWKNETPDALLSNLEKNQELKSAILAETPWVLNAKSESQRKRNVGILFDLNRMSNELDRALTKLDRMQCPNGGWPWFQGMPDDRYITQHIVTGMGHLDKLGVKDVKEDNKTWKNIRQAVRYLDDRIREDYEYLLKYYPETMDLNHLGGLQIQYLYARSYYMKRIPIENKNQKAFDYYKGQSQKYWLQNNRYLQGMISLALHRLDDHETAQKILNSLKENAIYNDEMGMYWKDSDIGYYWYQAPIETQALLIEAFDEVGNDQVTVEELKVWLLKQKQTQDWKTTKATVEACYALLLRGTDWLANEPDVTITVGGQEVDPKKIPDVKAEAGTGYFKTSWAAGEITPEMGIVKVDKRDDGVAWGAVYWQYFEQLDKITPAETPLKLDKKLFVERYTKTGPVIELITPETILKVGDKIKVRIELRVDRDMEYIHMKDMRASGFEPINVISRYKYQGGLGYYEATGDAATNFFISYMKKGTYVFEYPLRVSHKGNFSNGITSIQCMYAPEFTSHSEGIRVTVQ